MIEKTFQKIGIARHPPQNNTPDQWNYTTLSNPPKSHPDGDQWASSIYRGIVPFNNINQRDFAINGAIVRVPSYMNREKKERTYDNCQVHYQQWLFLRSSLSLDFLIFFK